MINTPVRLLRAAEEDLTDIITFIAAENVKGAEALAAKIEKDLVYLSIHAEIGRVPHEPELARAGYRYQIVENYLIFYTVKEKTVFVHRIIHGARDYKDLL